ncbi:MAG: LamG-like jellyroll fold domain-containing protein [Bryobacteraceae bacterium]
MGFRLEIETMMRDDVLLYVSFDRGLDADVAGGGRSPSTRFNHPDEAGRFVFEEGVDASVFRTGRGVHGAGLEAINVLPRNGRIFYPAQGNIAFRKGGWGGAVSFWMNSDPNRMLKTRFCDPVQITEKGANNGGLWVDFPDTTPRDFRLGAFAAGAGLAETDADAPLVRVRNVGFKAGDWHHIAMAWSNFDSGIANARAALYLDGKLAGELGGRAIAMDWNLDRTGIYVAVSYIGLLDELAVFRRPLTAGEVAELAGDPGILASLRRTP